MKQEYSGQLNVIFDANIAETNTFKITANEDRARSSADKAEGVLARIKEPTGEQKLQLTAAFVDTGQKEKAQGMMEVLRDIELESDLLERLDSLESKLSNMNMREFSAAINEEGVAHYEKGELTEAIKAFDKATRYEEAGISVLLNAIQAKVSYMEREEIDVIQLKDCYKLLRRIGSIGRLDERHERFVRLKTTCERLRRSAGL
jgi:tetratricopeptide (TPR) repeat protein